MIFERSYNIVDILPWVDTAVEATIETTPEPAATHKLISGVAVNVVNIVRC